MTTEPRCWLCAWQLNPVTAVRSDRDQRRPTCSDCARIRYGPGPPLGGKPPRRQPDHDAIACDILKEINDQVPNLPPEVQTFFEVLVRRAPSISSVRRLAGALDSAPGSLQSRFDRAGLPSVKEYLATVRLLYAARYFEDARVTCGLVAYRLDYSSPQSFNRHVKARLGIVVSEFRRVRCEALLDRFIETLIAPHRETLARFDPYPQRRLQAGSPRQKVYKVG